MAGMVDFQSITWLGHKVKPSGSGLQ